MPSTRRWASSSSRRPPSARRDHAGRGQHPALRPAPRRRVGGAGRDPGLARARRSTPTPTGVSVGIDINATHHRAATSGLVTAAATADPPRPHAGVLRGRDHRRAGQARVHVPDHLRADARATGCPAEGPAGSRPTRALRRLRRAASTWVTCRPAGRRAASLARTAGVGATRSTACGPSAEPGHEAVGLPRAGRRRGGDVADAELLGPGDRALDAAPCRCRAAGTRRRRRGCATWSTGSGLTGEYVVALR